MSKYGHRDSFELGLWNFAQRSSRWW